MTDELQIKYASELDYLRYIFNNAGVIVDEGIIAVQIDNAYKAIRKYLRLEESKILGNSPDNSSDDQACEIVEF